MVSGSQLDGVRIESESVDHVWTVDHAGRHTLDTPVDGHVLGSVAVEITR